MAQQQNPWEINWGSKDSTPAAPVDIQGTAKQYGLNPDIISQQVKQGSGGRQDAVSPKGGSGIMQLMPQTAKRLGVNPHDPQQNVQGGMQEMSRLLQKYNGDYAKALAAYNAGEGAVDRAGGVPDIPETKDYVNSILGEGKLAQANPWEMSWADPKQPSPQTATAADMTAKPAVQGDVRPTNKEVLAPSTQHTFDPNLL